MGDSPGDGVARPSVNRRNSHGLVAEEVQTVNPDLVARDRDGKPFTVRYDAVNAMLLNSSSKSPASRAANEGLRVAACGAAKAN